MPLFSVTQFAVGHILQVLAVGALAVALGAGQQGLAVDPAILEGDFLRGADLDALTLFHHTHEVGGIHQALHRAGVQPGKAAAQQLDVQLLGRGFAWLDTGTMESLVDAADFVRMVEKRQGIKISAPEEIAFKYGWIDRETLLTSAERYGKSPYGQHLKNVADGKLRY